MNGSYHTLRAVDTFAYVIPTCMCLFPSLALAGVSVLSVDPAPAVEADTQ